MNNHRITILYMIDQIYALYGTEKHLLEILQGLDRKIFTPVVVTFKPIVANEFEELEIPIFRVPIKKTYSLFNIPKYRKLAEIVSEYNVDIIETFHSTSDIVGPFIGKTTGCGVVLSNRRDMGFLRTKKHNIVYPYLNKMVNIIKVVCEAMADHFSKIERTQRGKYRVFYNGIHVERYSNLDIDRKLLRHSLGLKDSDIVIGVVGSIKEIKGQINLIDMALHLSDHKHKIKYLIVGGGFKYSYNPYYQQLIGLINEKGLKDKFIFTGHRNDVPDILQIINIGVLTSRTEGCSNVLLEYMASGKPVIATAVGGNPELVEDGVTGFLVPPDNGKALADKALKLINSEESRHKMGDAGFDRVMNKFSFNKIIEKEMEFYNHLINYK